MSLARGSTGREIDLRQAEHRWMIKQRADDALTKLEHAIQ